jgi:hypothetical protein
MLDDAKVVVVTGVHFTAQRRLAGDPSVVRFDTEAANHFPFYDFEIGRSARAPRRTELVPSGLVIWKNR